MFLEVALVTFLCLPEGGGRLDLGHYRGLPLATGSHLGPYLGGDARLGFTMGENHRTVLGTDIWSLAVAGGRVVHAEEQFDQGLVRYFGRVKAHLDPLRVVGVAMADLLVAGIVGSAAGIAADVCAHARHLAEKVFYAPETA